jgi:predicted nuclease with TOPRIM domain
MPVSSEIISAFDADATGRELAEVVRHAVELSGRLDLKFTVQEPIGHKDFNDVLRARPLPLLPYRPEVPSVA